MIAFAPSAQLVATVGDWLKLSGEAQGMDLSECPNFVEHSPCLHLRGKIRGSHAVCVLCYHQVKIISQSLFFSLLIVFFMGFVVVVM